MQVDRPGPQFEQWAPLVLVLVALGTAYLMVKTAMSRQLTQLEGVLFQSMSMAAALAGSYLFGRQSAQKAARDIIKPHASSAFRRVLSLYESLSRLAQGIADAKSEKEGKSPVLNKLEAIVVEQISTAGHAIEDWRDLVPEQVDQLERRLGHSVQDNSQAQTNE